MLSPKAVSILDYYQASEHLHKFASNYFKNDKEAGDIWVASQEALLKESRVEEVIKNIEALPNHKRKEGKILIEYYTKNKKRMDYKYYKTIGVGIYGSGAIESAHRTVIQKRMKQSGQRWTMEGA